MEHQVRNPKKQRHDGLPYNWHKWWHDGHRRHNDLAQRNTDNNNGSHNGPSKTVAQQYLNTNYPGTTVGQTTTFDGYYEMQVLKGTNYYGMITVNGKTGQVLYCKWLGTFMQRMVIG